MTPFPPCWSTRDRYHARDLPQRTIAGAAHPWARAPNGNAFLNFQRLFFLLVPWPPMISVGSANGIAGILDKCNANSVPSAEGAATLYSGSNGGCHRPLSDSLVLLIMPFFHIVEHIVEPRFPRYSLTFSLLYNSRWFLIVITYPSRQSFCLPVLIHLICM
jgi:hypothetical protein